MSPAITIKPRVEKLTPAHDVAPFDCATEPLNKFLKAHALPNQKSGSSQTYVALIGGAIVGYYSLSVGNVLHDSAPARLAKGLPRYPIPILLLARLAVHKDWQGHKLGAGLLLDAIRRTNQVADIAGVRALVVHAKDDKAKSFYAHFGFEAFSHEPLTLFRLIKDIRAMLES